MRPLTGALVVAIGHADVMPWSEIARRGQAKTWLANDDIQDVACIYVHGSGQKKPVARLDALHESVRWSRRFRGLPGKALRVLDEFATFPTRSLVPNYEFVFDGELARPRLRVAVPDTYLFAPMKELALFEFFLRYTQADWLYMTTTSSYVRPRKLLAAASSLGKEAVYAGTPIKAGSLTFASGANRLLSRDVVAAVYENRRRWQRSDLEDVGLGKLTSNLGFSLQPLGTLNVGSFEELAGVTEPSLRSGFHFRLKSGPLDARLDVDLMQALHARVCDAGLSELPRH